MQIPLVLPVKSFRAGNQRLSPEATPDQRRRLGEAMTSRVVEVAQVAGLDPVLVTDDREVAGYGEQLGLHTLTGTGAGIDAAAAAGVTWALEASLPWMVAHADLPLVAPDDFQVAINALEAGDEPIACSSDGGTSLIGGDGPFGFTYGPGSFHRHLGRLSRPAVIATTGLLHDLDTPTDLASVLTHPRGEWLNQAIR